MAIINLNKEVYNKNQYNKIIDTSFTQLTPQVSEENIIQLPSIDQFFDYYNSLFYQIPKLGDINSHQYLIEASSNYVGDSTQDNIITALSEEISVLRQENLDLQNQLVELQTNNTLTTNQ